jgi:hypothetical protein
MRQFWSLILLFSFLVASAQGQQEKEKLALQIVEETPSTLNDSKGLAQFWLSKTSSQLEFYTVAYVWVATHIRYDVAQLSKPHQGLSPEELIRGALNQRKAVCAGYSNLLVALLREANIQSHVVEGFTRNEWKIRNESHAWVAVYLNKQWNFSDPTWAAGYVKDKAFKAMFNWTWFSVEPLEMIKTHMPFDVAWQCMNKIVKPGCFVDLSCDFKPDLKFACSDTLTAYFKDTELQQIESVLNRIDRYGVKNETTLAYYNVLKYNAKTIRQNKEIDKQNEVAGQLNDIVRQVEPVNGILKQYFSLKNKKQGKTPKALALLQNAKTNIDKSKSDFDAIGAIPSALKANAEQLKKAISELNKVIIKELDN